MAALALKSYLDSVASTQALLLPVLQAIRPKDKSRADYVRTRDPGSREVMPTLVGFGAFAALPEEQISEKISRRILSGDQGMIIWWSIGAGVQVEPAQSPE